MTTSKIPVHSIPLPVNPELQAHVNDPTVFVQAAFLSQLSVLRVHSLLSKIDIKECTYRGIFPTYDMLSSYSYCYV